MNLMSQIEKESCKKKVPEFNIGDTVDVHVKIKEGDKERIQVFNGIVIARKNAGLRETFTVRRIVQGEGVERIFLVHSPLVANIVVKKGGNVKRAKLYYLRDRKGRSARIKELVGMIPGAETLVEEEKEIIVPVQPLKTEPEQTDKK
jgi:large subunit ribosomal protein L19